MIPGTIAWNDAGNNKAYIAGDISLTFNGVSIYFVLKNSPDPEAAGDSGGYHAPEGAAGPGEAFAHVGGDHERHAVQAQ